MNYATAQSGFQMKWSVLFAGVFCLAMATVASAEQTARPCREDAAKLCQDVKPGHGAIARCLKEHSNDLSPACKSNMAKAKAKARKKAGEFKKACSDDAKKVCEGVKPGGGRILKCLKQHEAELSPSCKELMDKPRGRI